MKKLFFTVISLIGFTISAMAQCPPAATSSSNVVLTQRVAKVGMLNGVFSVAANTRVSFSKGNLQYRASDGKWQFAEHQWDYIGNAQGNTTASSDRASQTHWIDLFNYGTSGYNSKAPYDVNAYYNEQLSSSGVNYDWGVYNAGQLGDGWKTLNSGEWTYLLQRKNADDAYLFASATVHGVKGMILFPDGWRQANSAVSMNIQLGATNFNNNIVSDDNNWEVLEREGAVFLPCAGNRGERSVTVNQANQYGYYWTGSYYWNARSYYVNVNGSTPTSGSSMSCQIGCSVRLAHIL